MKIKRFKIVVEAEAIAKPKNHPSAGNVIRLTNTGFVQTIESYLSSQGYDIESIKTTLEGVEE